MDVESGALASPIILRGTVNTTGKTFKMLILAVDEHELLARQRTSKYSEDTASQVETWINSITQFVRKISNVILAIIVFFHLIALIFKIKGLPKG